jgi:hypothetical protein
MPIKRCDHYAGPISVRDSSQLQATKLQKLKRRQLISLDKDSFEAPSNTIASPPAHTQGQECSLLGRQEVSGNAQPILYVPKSDLQVQSTILKRVSSCRTFLEEAGFCGDSRAVVQPFFFPNTVSVVQIQSSK